MACPSTVEEGEIFAILGPNGAGKTTTVESIAGLRTPDSGHIEVFGFDPLVDRAEVRSRLGVQLQESRFQDRVKCEEIVETFASFYPDPLDVATLLERLGLTDKADTLYSRLSGGQQQRVSIAVALVGRPRGGDPRRADHRSGPAGPTGDLGAGRGSSRTAVSPSSWSPISWRRRRGSPTDSPSSTKDVSSPWTRRVAWSTVSVWSNGSDSPPRRPSRTPGSRRFRK